MIDPITSRLFMWGDSQTVPYPEVAASEGPEVSITRRGDETVSTEIE